MDITAKRDQDGRYILEMGPVFFELPISSLEMLHKLLEERLSNQSDEDLATLHKKIKAYRALASKLVAMDDRVLQKLVTKLSAEQLVTLVRLAEGKRLFNKVIRNLSRQNGQQFQQDYHDLNKITLHQATLYMEQAVPMIRQAANEQKALMK
ncbi:MAG: FliG C-terminal domain-containing protein [Hydrogenovibrio sp.]